MKKLIIGSLGLITATMPVVAVVSCSNKKTQSVNFLKEEAIDKSKLVKYNLTPEQQKILDTYAFDEEKYVNSTFDDFLLESKLHPSEENDKNEPNLTTSLYRYEGSFVIAQSMDKTNKELCIKNLKMIDFDKAALEEMVSKTRDFIKSQIEINDADHAHTLEENIKIFEHHGLPKYAQMVKERVEEYKVTQDMVFNDKNGVVSTTYKIIDPIDGKNKVSYATIGDYNVKRDSEESSKWFLNKIDDFVNQISKTSSDILPITDPTSVDHLKKDLQTFFMNDIDVYPYNNKILEAITTYKPAEEAK